MDSALGPPAAMAERRGELTPMMAQYYELCERYDDALVLFQVGDFYETFCEAAERTARLLELTLTSREDSTGEYPMTGIPVDDVASYVETLLDAGYRVAIADQVEDPAETTGVVERAVTRVVTPGTLTEDELLASEDNNFVAALAGTPETEGAAERGASAAGDPAGPGDDRDGAVQLAIALLDVSTGDFFTTSSSSSESIADELARFDPPEAIVGPAAPGALVPEGCMVTPYDRTAFDVERTRDRVEAYFGDPDALLTCDAEIRACGALLQYAEYARGGVAIDGAARSEADDTDPDDGGDETDRDGGGDETDRDGASDATDPDSVDADDGDGTEIGDGLIDEPKLDYLTTLTRYDPREHLLLDAVALRSLELFEPRAVHGREDATLVGVLDETASALGARELRDWLRRPLLDPDRIEGRLDAVAELHDDLRTRERLHDLLRDVYDLERLIGRISRERANARDLRSLRDTLSVVPDVRDELADAESDRLQELRASLDPLADVRALIDRSIVADPPLEITEGGIVAEGYDDDLDALRATARDGEEWIEALEERERERTGVDSLKVGYNSVHGYYIEVTNPNLEAVPDAYERRQTLKRAERFVTPELKRREDEIVTADRRADEREYELFREVRREVADEVERVQSLAGALAALDALVSLATVAAEYDYCRPEIVRDDGGPDGDDRRIEIEGGRHPVVERTQDSFVPNDARFSADRRLAVITGPNMSGKSTYMRQVALIVVMAQVGSFVPANSARLAPFDRIFTRVGASDDIAGGRSTFMVEMDELATILAEADERSLVLLDEVGRGTSTADGVAIARAITEHLHDAVGATTLFATHHHPLTALVDELPAAVARHFTVSREDGEVVFHHEIEPGTADGSYGVEVASAAGVPDVVVDRARELVDAPDDATADAATDSVPDDDGAGSPNTTTADGGDDPTDVAAELRALDLAHLTPVEALTELDRLKRLLEE